MQIHVSNLEKNNKKTKLASVSTQKRSPSPPRVVAPSFSSSIQ